jgi:hypothetical protein
MKLNFKQWLNEVSSSTADVAVVPNRLFGSSFVPYYAQPIDNYVKFGLGGKVVNSQHGEGSKEQTKKKKKKSNFFDL